MTGGTRREVEPDQRSRSCNFWNDGPSAGSATTARGRLHLHRAVSLGDPVESNVTAKPRGRRSVCGGRGVDGRDYRWKGCPIRSSCFDGSGQRPGSATVPKTCMPVTGMAGRPGGRSSAKAPALLHPRLHLEQLLDGPWPTAWTPTRRTGARCAALRMIRPPVVTKPGLDRATGIVVSLLNGWTAPASPAASSGCTASMRTWILAAFADTCTAKESPMGASAGIERRAAG